MASEQKKSFQSILPTIHQASYCRPARVASGTAQQLATGAMSKPRHSLSHVPFVGPIAPIATFTSFSAPSLRSCSFSRGELESIGVVLSIKENAIAKGEVAAAAKRLKCDLCLWSGTPARKPCH